METRDTRTYYLILGVDNDATLADIRKSYRKLAMNLHPDKQGTPVASSNPVTQATTEEKAKPNQKEEQFKKVVEAYTCLSDPGKRKEYDEVVMNGDTDIDLEERSYQYSKVNAERFTLFMKREDILPNIRGAIMLKDLDWLFGIYLHSLNRLDVFNFIMEEILSLDIDYGDFFVQFIRDVDNDSIEGLSYYSKGINIQPLCVGFDYEDGQRYVVKPCYLHQAIKKRYQKLAGEIIQRGLYTHIYMWDKDLRDEHENTTIQLAIKSRSDEIRDIYLKSYKAEMKKKHSLERELIRDRVNYQNSDGESAFFAAIKHRCPWSVIEDLASFGGDAYLENAIEERPIDLLISAVREELSCQISILDKCAQTSRSNEDVCKSLIRLKNTTIPLYNKILNELYCNSMKVEKAAALLSILSSYIAKVEGRALDDSSITELITSLAKFETSVDWKTLLGVFVGAVIGLVIAWNTVGVGLPLISSTVNACIKTLAMGAIGAGAGFWKTRSDDPVRHFQQDLVDHYAAAKNDI